MSSENNVETQSDPFADRVSMTSHRLEEETTLTVGRNATLTLGTESLIVFDEGFVEPRRFNCCGLIPSRSRKTRAIPYFNILWVSVTKVEITVQYAKPSSKTDVQVSYINYPLDHSMSSSEASTKAWTEKLLGRAYGDAQRMKRLLVLINPHGGAGKAEKYFTRDIEPIFAAARCDLNVIKTKYSGHATEIAQQMDLESSDAVVCASGDGLCYEVFNGLGKRSDATDALARMPVAMLPCGSGNAMSWNLNGTGSPSMAALCIVKGLRMRMDLASITQGNQRYLSFLSQAIGIVADADLGTDNIRWMGPARFTYGFLVRLLGKTTYPCDIAVKVEINDKAAIKSHYESIVSSIAKIGPSDTASQSTQPSSTSTGLPPLRYGTTTSDLPTDYGWTPLTPFPTLGNLYSGNMCYMAPDAPFFQCALPSDGFLDLVTVDGTIPRHVAVSSLLSVEKGQFFNQKCVDYCKVSAYRVVPRFERGVISIDGESIPFGPFQVEMHKGLGTVLSKSGRLYESEGPKDILPNNTKSTTMKRSVHSTPTTT